MKKFAGKVAVITGAASGFGLAFAHSAQRLGMRLVLADIDAAALAEVTTTLRAQGTAVIAETIDVAQAEDLQRLADRTYAEFGAVDLLFNNAGVGGAGGFLWEGSDNDWRWIVGVNLLSVANGIRAFVPRMLAVEAGAVADDEPAHIVNTASIAGWLCAPLMGAYSATKHAVVATSETLFHDLALAKSRIGVSVLCPAFVPTGIANSQRHRPASLASDAPLTPSQRLAQVSSERAVAAGKLSAAEVAEQTFEAIRARRFYIFTHPPILPSVRARFDAVIANADPADPFAAKPSARPVVPNA